MNLYEAYGQDTLSICSYDDEEPDALERTRQGHQVLKDLMAGIPTIFDLRIARHDFLYAKILDHSATQEQRNVFTQVRSDLLEEWGFQAWNKLLGYSEVMHRLNNPPFLLRRDTKS